MNIYEKLSTARVELQGMNIKKSGKNKFADYTYYELADFLPEVNKLCAIHKMLPIVSFYDGYATMKLIDCNKPEDSIEFFSPFGSAALKGCHEVQNIGAVESYQRRYLYMTAFEIVEHDALDSTMNPNEKPAEKKPLPKTEKEVIPGKTIEQKEGENPFAEEEVYICSNCPKEIPKKVFDYSLGKYGKPLCMTCQKEVK